MSGRPLSARKVLGVFCFLWLERGGPHSLRPQKVDVRYGSEKALLARCALTNGGK